MRLARRTSDFLSLLLHIFIILYSIACSSALPTPAPNLDDGTSDLVSSASGTINVFDPVTQQIVAQGVASDGAGSDFDIPAVLWIVGVAIIGLPLAIAGVKGGRMTSGVGVGLGLSVAFWASIINTVNSTGVPDFLLFLLVLLLFGVGVGVGFLTVDYAIGSLTLGAVGGLSIGIRVVLLRKDLLIPIFLVNWVVAGVFGLLGSVMVITRERIGVIVGSASAGTFLVGLGVDLFLNRQSGMSRGLRFLFDRNSNHLADILGHGYTPSLITQITIGVSLALIPVFALSQHKFFPGPFWNRDRRASWLSLDNYSIHGRSWAFWKRRAGQVGGGDDDGNLGQAKNRLRKLGGMEISRPLSANPPRMKSRFSL